MISPPRRPAPRRAAVRSLAVAAALALAAPALADVPPPPGTRWVQVASGPTREAAVERARGFAEAFPHTRVLLAETGWYAVVVGWRPESRVADDVARWKAARRIPADSFATDGRSYVSEVWRRPGAAPAASAAAEAAAGEARLVHAERVAIQRDLIWTGDYRSRADGAFGRGTRTAIRAFQRRHGLPDTGILSPAARARLAAAAAAARKAAGFETVAFREAGLEIGLATALFAFEERTEAGLLFAGRRDRALALLVSERGDPGELRAMHEDLVGDPDLRIRYRRLREDWTVVAFETSDRTRGYLYARAEAGAVKGFLILWPEERSDVYEPIVNAMFDGLRTTPGTSLPPGRVDPAALALADPGAGPGGARRRPPSANAARRAPESGRKAKPAEAPPQDASGTGFFVSREGEALTNAHVVEGCRAIEIDGRPAELVALDPELDLALLRLASGAPPERAARLSARPVRLNADVTVAGYPYHGLLSGLNVTRGSVSALAGLGGTREHFQITAPVQPGNSGGPVLGAGGEVLGVVVAKLDAFATASLTGSLPENVNFAIRAEVAAAFLSEHHVDYALVVDPEPLDGVTLAKQAADYTALVACRP